jgi:hypothetical protein
LKPLAKLGKGFALEIHAGFGSQEWRESGVRSFVEVLLFYELLAKNLEK